MKLTKDVKDLKDGKDKEGTLSLSSLQSFTSFSSGPLESREIDVVVARVPGDAGVAQQDRLGGLVADAGALGHGVGDRPGPLDLDQGEDRPVATRPRRSAGTRPTPRPRWGRSGCA